MEAISNVNRVQFGQVFQPAESNDRLCLLENARPATITHLVEIRIIRDRLARCVERRENRFASQLHHFRVAVEGKELRGVVNSKCAMFETRCLGPVCV